MADPYTVLGISRSASKEEIKRAFLKLAHKHHPDKGGDAAKFKEISNAYASIKDASPQAAQQAAPRGFTADTVFFDEGGNVTDDFWTKASELLRKQKQKKAQDAFMDYRAYTWTEYKKGTAEEDIKAGDAVTYDPITKKFRKL